MHVNKRIWFGSIVSIVALTVASVPAAAQQPKKPNIVVILMDNLGYGELGVYGGGILRGAATPRIDALASEGMRLLNFNVEAQCTPSRSALLTGRFAIRSGTYEVPIGGVPDGLTREKSQLPRCCRRRATQLVCGVNGISAAPKTGCLQIRDLKSGMASRALTTRRCGRPSTRRRACGRRSETSRAGMRR